LLFQICSLVAVNRGWR